MSDGYAIKLVRDDITRTVPNVDGGEVYFKPVGQTTHIRLLRQKLLEEVGEYLAAPCLSELVDVLEVDEALAKVSEGAGPRELREAKVRKIKERGRFVRGTAMYCRPSTQPQGEEASTDG
jgi:predicted house-cleaning noncanonical NTP pyrophosphatase (MazG superfamily)